LFVFTALKFRQISKTFKVPLTCFQTFFTLNYIFFPQRFLLSGYKCVRVCVCPCGVCVCSFCPLHSCSLKLCSFKAPIKSHHYDHPCDREGDFFSDPTLSLLCVCHAGGLYVLLYSTRKISMCAIMDAYKPVP